MNYKQRLTEEKIAFFDHFLHGAAHNGQKALSLMWGYVELWRAGGLGPLTDEQAFALAEINGSLFMVREHLVSPLHYFELLLSHPHLYWSCVGLDEVIELAIGQVAPFLDNEGVEVNLLPEVPLIKGDDHWLPMAIAGLLYKGRRGPLSLDFSVRDQSTIVGKLRTVKSPLDKTIPELFEPGRRSGQRLAVTKLVFESYGSSVGCRVVDEWYEFEFRLFICEEDMEQKELQ